MAVGLEKQAKRRGPKTTNILTPRSPSADSSPHSNLFSRQAALHPLCSALVHLFGEFTLIIDPAGNILSVRSLVSTSRSFIGKHISSLLDRELSPILDAALTRVSASGRKEYTQCRLDRPDGPRWFQVLLVPFTDRRGISRIGLFARDVTESKESRNALFQNLKMSLNRKVDGMIVKALLRQAETLARLGSFQLNLRTYELTWSEQLFRNLGLDPRGGITWASFLKLIHPEDRGRVLLELEQSIAHHKSLDSEFRCVLANGDVRFLHRRAVPLCDDAGEPLTLVGIVLDVTERKLVEERLRHREALLAQAERLADLGSWEWNLETSQVTWSDHRYRLFGLDPQSQPPTIDNFWNHLHPDDRERVRAAFQKSISQGCPLEYEARFVLSDGRIRTLHTRGVPFLNSEGRTIRLTGMAQDVTNRRREEDRLRRSEALLAQAEEIANVGSWEHDVKSARTVLSKHLLHMLGIGSGEEWDQDHSWNHLLLSDPDLRSQWARAIEECKPFEFTTRYRMPDGAVRIYRVVSRPIAGADGCTERVLGVVHDITEYTHIEDARRRLSQQLVRTRDSERRQLARELHESAGQSLAALKMSLANLQEALGGESPAALDHFKQARGFAEDAIREIRVISYLMYPPLLDDAGLGPALHWYIRGFSERSGIKAAVEIPSGFGRYSQEIESAIFSIVQEALTNVHRYSGSPTVVVRLSSDGASVRAEIQDQGCGFSPFPHLHPGAAGFGVGIPGMRERVTQLDGSFEVLSTPGHGTLVRAVLPAVAQKPASLGAVSD